MKTFYITTTLPYVNADPHLGFALESVHADVIARFHALKGEEVFFSTGTDEHGTKIYKKAKEQGKDPQSYVDEYAEKFKELKDKNILNLSVTNFIRTTDEAHKKAAQEFWRRCNANGDMYKKYYKVKYCVGCELEKTEAELEEGRCPIHPKTEIETIEEENYFFRFSKYQNALLELYKQDQHFVLPESRFTEITKFVHGGLEDFSVSRLKEKMPWGVPVPDDNEHVMYVWFDALVNYVSAIGWPASAKAPAGTASQEGAFEKWWPVVQIAGKDNVRQQSAMWQSMLMSAGLPPSKRILIHGFITSGGHKMSKSTGNVVDPLALISEYGTDALRYYLIREIPTFEDGDFTEAHFKETYNANLANGLGNLVARVLKMAETNLDEPFRGGIVEDVDVFKEYEKHMNQFELQKAADVVWAFIGELDLYIQKNEPFKTIKIDKEKAESDIRYLLQGLFLVANMVLPFMPETGEKIKEALSQNRMPKPLFMRKE